MGAGQELQRACQQFAPAFAPANRQSDKNGGAEAAAVGSVETPTEVNPEAVETDFSAALRMLAGLPLSDEERAEAVRRLLKGTGP